MAMMMKCSNDTDKGKNQGDQTTIKYGWVRILPLFLGGRRYMYGHDMDITSRVLRA